MIRSFYIQGLRRWIHTQSLEEYLQNLQKREFYGLTGYLLQPSIGHNICRKHDDCKANQDLARRCAEVYVEENYEL